MGQAIPVNKLLERAKLIITRKNIAVLCCTDLSTLQTLMVLSFYQSPVSFSVT